MKLAKSMVIAAVALAVACGQGADGGGGKVDSAARQAEWTALETQKRQLDAKRGELATLRQQAAAGTDVAAALTAVNDEVTRLSDDLGSKLAAYINADPPVVGEPIRPEQQAAIRLKSSEDIAIAREFIELGGDYRRAIDIYNQALSIDPDNAELKAALADAESKRFMTPERFAAVKKGMSEADVVAALGRPLARNVRDYPEKKVSAWFYPKNDTGEAAGVFFNDKKTVYSTDFDAVKRADQGGGQ
jgi:tetratricopeptide (TPR) repeat protein